MTVSQSLEERVPLRLFLVEDSAALRELLIESFSAVHGIVVSGFATTEDDAFEQIQGAGCDIVVIDIHLHQGNGISLLRRLAAEATVSIATRIILSNNVSPTLQQAAAQIASCFFFDKTTEFAELQQFLIDLATGYTVVAPRS